MRFAMRRWLTTMICSVPMAWTTTQLTPSGKARFDDRMVDVITECEVVGRGCEVEVVEVRGNRVFVRPVA